MEVREFKELLRRVKSDYPDFRFQTGKKFAFRPPRTIVIVEITQPSTNLMTEKQKAYSETEHKIYALRLLHELGHATLGHYAFTTDVERLKMERAAWEQARDLCNHYGIEYNEEFIEAELDTYRDWLHQRSKCSNCGQTRYQTADSQYHCPFCRS